MRRRGRRGLQESNTSAEVDTDPPSRTCPSPCLWVGLACGLVSAVTAEPALPQAVRVIRVVDGDTMVVSTAESLNLKVRMQGIDAPECGMPFGPQAKSFLEQLVLGRTVQMTTTGRDRYGRTVVTMAVGEQDLGLTLLQAGLAWHDRRYHRPRLQGATGHYAEAQQDEPRQVAPWQWRAGGGQSRIRPYCIGDATRGRTP